ncbi:hypothetical protein FHR81_000563 [Actinoalloteichus hoggarensis]|uniref:Uncharacterized protein n=1 Tax=Actinoalloteichus hoggarensis TaxID=1470176 RepID=A0A221W246_9PSEU|nr:hypothetical protein AHOG_10580 [Actinoalloteichus hoggarensis]MBB5919534.1 hypothetical protein [Actinoalloteichus hoggarensis]
MSVTEMVARLRRAHALLADARRAATEADTAITDGATIFADATAGSTQPEVERTNRLARASGEEVRAARDRFIEAQGVIDGYCHDIAGHGIGDDAHVTPPTRIDDDDRQAAPPEDSAPTGGNADPAARYAGWIAELRRGGTKISPKKIVRMTRLRGGRIVWMERGNGGSGLDHIQSEGRPDEFEALGTRRDQIPELIFAALERGRGGRIQREGPNGVRGGHRRRPTPGRDHRRRQRLHRRCEPDPVSPYPPTSQGTGQKCMTSRSTPAGTRNASGSASQTTHCCSDRSRRPPSGSPSVTSSHATSLPGTRSTRPSTTHAIQGTPGSRARRRNGPGRGLAARIKQESPVVSSVNYRANGSVPRGACIF